MTVKLGFIVAISTALLSPFWHFYALGETNPKVWLAGNLILLALWISLFVGNIYYKKWNKKQYMTQAVVGFFCFLPFVLFAFTLIIWAIGGFGP